jgi:hypothetical protein
MRIENGVFSPAGFTAYSLRSAINSGVSVRIIAKPCHCRESHEDSATQSALFQPLKNRLNAKRSAPLRSVLTDPVSQLLRCGRASLSLRHITLLREFRTKQFIHVDRFPGLVPKRVLTLRESFRHATAEGVESHGSPENCSYGRSEQEDANL